MGDRQKTVYPLVDRWLIALAKDESEYSTSLPLLPLVPDVYTIPRSPSKDIESDRVSGLGVKQLARFSGQKIHSPVLQFRGSGILGVSLGRPSRRWHARQLSESVWPIVLCRSFDLVASRDNAALHTARGARGARCHRLQRLHGVLDFLHRKMIVVNKGGPEFVHMFKIGENLLFIVRTPRLLLPNPAAVPHLNATGGHDINFVPTLTMAFSAVCYMTSYATKYDVSQHQLIGILTAAILKRALEDAKSVADPSETQLRIRRHDMDKFALRAFNRLSSDREISGPQAASCLLGHPGG